MKQKMGFNGVCVVCAVVAACEESIIVTRVG